MTGSSVAVAVDAGADPAGRGAEKAAARYLRESTLAIGEIAYLLGYSEPAAFHRAFRRWYASTPERFRSRGRTRLATSG